MLDKLLSEELLVEDSELTELLELLSELILLAELKDWLLEELSLDKELEVLVELGVLELLSELLELLSELILLAELTSETEEIEVELSLVELLDVLGQKSRT
jgi:hypothetical protein